ncbi:MAG TPA: class I SAM-dependent methyltransferase [Polyangia bacterium]|nr:class I SAM-dependent methyltransferase [Polyangia bacterium]
MATDAVAERVRTFYERHPYPPPVEGLEGYRRQGQDRERRRADHHLFWPARAYRETATLLIAGCGTSQAARYAMRWPATRVIGIDVSATSVRCTEELKRRYDLANLEIHQLPIEKVGELGASFDRIICTGVLHHLADPDAGLAALREVLEPDGAMHLMVYAPHGRTGVYMLQEFCRRLGIQANDDEIGGLMTALRALPPGHPLQPLLREAPDFQDASALADALLHPCDRPYSVPELFDFLDRARLAFGRWLRQGPYSPRCGVLARLPQRERLARLPAREQYAAVELFRGTMARHSLIVYRDFDHAAAQRLDFASDACSGYVPMRASDTICVRERLPPGAAAVLINSAHTCTDIILPIDASELELFEAIDGRRSVGEIARPPGRLKAARAFFERLHQHDQVVFDTSGGPPR